MYIVLREEELDNVVLREEELDNILRSTEGGRVGYVVRWITFY